MYANTYNCLCVNVCVYLTRHWSIYNKHKIMDINCFYGPKKKVNIHFLKENKKH